MPPRQQVQRSSSATTIPSSAPPVHTGIVLAMKHRHNYIPVPSASRACSYRRRHRTLALACLGSLSLIAACGGNDRPVADAGDSFCSQLSASSDLAQSLDDPVTNGQRVVDSFERLAELAPDDIRSDVRLVSDAMVTLVTTPTDDPAALSAALDTVLSPKITAATERVGQYAVESCGIEPSAFAG